MKEGKAKFVPHSGWDKKSWGEKIPFQIRCSENPAGGEWWRQSVWKGQRINITSGFYDMRKMSVRSDPSGAGLAV